jgi:ATP-dependent helicase HrpA
VLDEHGNAVAQGRDLEALQERFGQKAQRQFMDRLGGDYQRDNERDWVFGELPRSVLVTHGQGRETQAWPAVVDQDDAAGLRLFDTAEEAALEHHHGVLRLLTVKMGSKLRSMRKQHGLSAHNLLAWSATGSPDALVADLVTSSLALTAGKQPVNVRDEAGFAALLDEVRGKLGIVFRQQVTCLDQALQAWAELNAALDDEFFNLRPDVFNDMRGQLDDMVYEGFLGELAPGRLQHYPRYLEAMRIRLRGVEQDPQRDAERMAQVEPYWRAYLDLLEQGVAYDEAMDSFRWLIEEFRVSIFAQARQKIG